jgi:hypothetical protein
VGAARGDHPPDPRALRVERSPARRVRVARRSRAGASSLTPPPTEAVVYQAPRYVHEIGRDAERQRRMRASHPRRPGVPGPGSARWPAARRGRWDSCRRALGRADVLGERARRGSDQTRAYLERRTRDRRRGWRRSDRRAAGEPSSAGSRASPETPAAMRASLPSPPPRRPLRHRLFRGDLASASAARSCAIASFSAASVAACAASVSQYSRSRRRAFSTAVASASQGMRSSGNSGLIRRPLSVR